MPSFLSPFGYISAEIRSFFTLRSQVSENFCRKCRKFSVALNVTINCHFSDSLPDCGIGFSVCTFSIPKSENFAFLRNMCS